MLNISKEESKVFDNKIIDDYESRVSIYFKDEYLEETKKLTKDDLNVFIDETILEATKYDLLNELSVTQWCCLSLSLGEHLHESVNIDEFFNAKELSQEH